VIASEPGSERASRRTAVPDRVFRLPCSRTARELPAGTKPFVIAGATGTEDPSMAQLAPLRGGDWRSVVVGARGDFVACFPSCDGRDHVVFRSLMSTLPVFFRDDGIEVTWAIEVSALFPSEGPTLADVDVDVLPIVLKSGPLSGELTCFRGVRKLNPGQALVVGEHGSRILQVDTLEPTDDARGLSLLEAGEALRELIRASVRRSLAGVTESAVCLSGGIDSGVVAEAGVQRASLVGYHCLFTGVEPLEGERVRAEEIARYLGMEFIPLDMSSSVGPAGRALEHAAGQLYPVLNCFERFYYQLGEELTERGISSIVDGSFGDNLFVGNESRLYGRKPGDAPLRGFGLRSAIDVLGGVFTTWSQVSGRKPRPILSPATFATFDTCLSSGAMASVERYFLDLASQPDADFMTVLAVYGDRYSAIANRAWFRHGLSIAHPLRDRQVIEYCLGLEPWHKVRLFAGQRVQKAALRAGYLGALPASIIKGYPKSIYTEVHDAYVRHNRRRILDLLSESSVLAGLGMIEPGKVKQFVLDGGIGASAELVPLVGTELWLRWLAGEPIPAHDRP
jgi:asparagine synthetase B (glutamine-hydrolysing)